MHCLQELEQCLYLACGLLALKQSGLASYLIAPPGTNVTHGKCLVPPTGQKIVTKLVRVPLPTIAPADLAERGVGVQRKVCFPYTTRHLLATVSERQVFLIYLLYQLPYFLSLLTYYRMIRRGQHLTSSPTNNTHTRRPLYTVYYHFTYPHLNNIKRSDTSRYYCYCLTIRAISYLTSVFILCKT